MYPFVYVSLDKCPSIRDWKLMITPEDNLIPVVGIPKLDSILNQANDGFIQSYSERYFSDRHLNLEDNLKRSEASGKAEGVFVSMIYHPMILDGQKRDAMVKFMLEGRTILINRNGGYSFLQGHTILHRQDLDTMTFPIEADTVEKITISRYPGCKHYYLSSNFIGRIFAHNPFRSKASAMEAAKECVPETQITVKEDSYAYATNGG